MTNLFVSEILRILAIFYGIILLHTFFVCLGNEETAEMIRKAGGKAHTYTVDVSNK